MDSGDNTLKTELIKTGGVTREFFASYISYARRFCQPKIPDYIVQDLIQNYLAMRNMGNMKKTITATPRQLESMIRIAESLAKMRLSDNVEKRDVEEAVRLIKTAMQQSATDPTTGEIDMDIIATGVSTSQNARVKEITRIIMGIQKDYKNEVGKSGLLYKNLFDFIEKKLKDPHSGAAASGRKEHVLAESELRDALRQLEDDNVLALYGNQRNPTIRFVQE